MEAAMDIEIYFISNGRSAAFTPLHHANAEAILKSPEMSALKRAKARAPKQRHLWTLK
jgi:hypothetical protein